MAHELSAWSLLIVSIPVSRLHNLLFTVSYRCFISCMSFLKFFSLSLSVKREKYQKRHARNEATVRTVNSKLWSLETRIDTISRDQGEISCAIQSKLDALLRNSTAQDKLVTDRTQGNRVDFVEPRRNQRESTPLPRSATSAGAGGVKDNFEGWKLELNKRPRGFHHEN